MYKLNTDTLREDMQKFKPSNDGNLFFDLKTDHGMWFYLLPPYSERGRVVKHVRKVWLQDVKRTHTFFPDDESDPVKEAIDKAPDPTEFKPRTIAYGNILVVSHGKLGSKFEKIDNPRPQVFGFPVSVTTSKSDGSFRGILDIILEDPGILDPEQATAFYIERTGEKLETKYTLTLSCDSSPDGFERKVENLIEKYGEEIRKHFDSPPDLDTVWKVTDKKREAAKELADKLLATFSS